LLFMIRPDRLARFQAGLPFMPRLHRAWTAADDVAPSDLRQIMLDAVASARGRGWGRTDKVDVSVVNS